MNSYVSEIISAIIGFISGGFTVGIVMTIKYNRISSKQNGDNIASSGGVAAGNVQGNIVITNSPQIVDNTPVLSAEAERILKSLFPNTHIFFNKVNLEMSVYSDTRSQRKIILEDYSCTVEALNELVTYQYLECKQTTQCFTIYQLTANGRIATTKIAKQ